MSSDEQILTAKMVNDMAEDVKVVINALEDVAKKVINYMFWNIKNNNLEQVITNFVRFNPEFHPDCDDPRAADWLFVLNTLNFSLWNPKSAKQWTVDGLTGYHALSAALKRAIDEDKPIWNPKYYSKLTKSDAEVIFRSDDNETSIPLLNRRIEVLHEIGQTLLDVYEGTFEKFLRSCERDSSKMIFLLFQQFETYQDEATYKGNTVRFAIKARMLLQDIWIYFNNYEFGLEFQVPNVITTMFMDYRSFQVLYHLKALRYSAKLITKFEKEDELTQGSAEEIEIRSCSLYIIETVCTHVIEMCEHRKTQIPELGSKNFNIAILIDNFLWDYRQKYDQELKENVPYHNISSEQY